MSPAWRARGAGQSLARAAGAPAPYCMSVVLMVSKIDVMIGAKFVTPPTSATLTRAAISPYSDVAAEVSRIRLERRFFTVLTRMKRGPRSPSRLRDGPDRLSRLEPLRAFSREVDTG